MSGEGVANGVVIDMETGAVEPSSLPPKRASLRFMFSHPAHFVALGFGSGLSPVAPGTVGTLYGWLSFLVLNLWLSEWQWGVLIAISFIAGCLITAVSSRNLNVKDPGCIVWDEIVAFWLVLLLVTPAGFWAQFTAFVLFRYFDAVKPGPVGWADARFKGGFGIMFDDLVAAFCTMLSIALWKHLFGG